MFYTITTASQFGGQFNQVEFGDKGNSLFLSFGAPITHENDLERALNFMGHWQNSLPAAFAPDAIWEAMNHDKKRRGRILRWILPRAIGRVEIVEDVPMDIVKSVLQELSEE